ASSLGIQVLVNLFAQAVEACALRVVKVPITQETSLLGLQHSLALAIVVNKCVKETQLVSEILHLLLHGGDLLAKVFDDRSVANLSEGGENLLFPFGCVLRLAVL